MRLVERVTTDGGPVPDILYHGTSQAAWKAIHDSDQMTSDETVAFTTDWQTAARHALEAAERVGENYGVVMAFDGNELAHEHAIEPTGGTEMSHSSRDWQIAKPVIHNIKRFITGSEKAHW